MILDLGIAAVVFFAAFFISTWLGSLKAVERGAEQPSKTDFQEAMGSLVNAASMTNGLLAVILVIILMRSA